ncbi:MAG: RHS repeat protein [Planctomycetes bacterium]|nr:RHS repeat protein [Planctomycetota bacterium]
MTRTTDPLTFTTDQVYDPWSRVTKRTDAESKSTTYEFDAGSQLTKVIYPASGQGSGPNVVTEYDGLGRRTKVLNDSSVAVLRFYYDRLGRQTKLEYANGDAETYDYSIAGLRTKLTRPTTEIISYLYNSRGLLTKTTLPGSVDQTYSYDAAGRRTRAEDPNTDLQWFIDAAGRVTKLTDGKLSKTIVNAYDAAGRRTSLDGPEASDTQAWSFDAVGRVTKITENASNRAESLYNLAGEQTKLTYGSGSYALSEYDAAGQLTNLAHKKAAGTVIQCFGLHPDSEHYRTTLQPVTVPGDERARAVFRFDDASDYTTSTQLHPGSRRPVVPMLSETLSRLRRLSVELESRKVSKEAGRKEHYGVSCRCTTPDSFAVGQPGLVFRAFAPGHGRGGAAWPQSAAPFPR